MVKSFSLSLTLSRDLEELSHYRDCAAEELLEEEEDVNIGEPCRAVDALIRRGPVSLPLSLPRAEGHKSRGKLGGAREPD